MTSSRNWWLALRSPRAAAARQSSAAEGWRITITPSTPGSSLGAGVHVLASEGGQRAYLTVPTGTSAQQPIPLVIAFHGAGGRGSDFVTYPMAATNRGMAFLAPNSLNLTWDMMDGAIGPDVTFVNSAIRASQAYVNVDTARVALMGFSDGASYALTLGLENGDRTRRVIAHSPGFFDDVQHRANPQFYVSHGTGDTIIGIDHASRTIVPQLRAFGDLVTYVEFAGGHQVPTDIEQAAMSWLAASWA